MSARKFLKAERNALADLLLEVGPDAPTLCAGWATRDLAAHLVTREDRPDAALGIALGPLSGYTKKVQAQLARQPYPQLVRRVRGGPGFLGPFAIPGVDAAVNVLEYFVHHEDVRRALPGWQPRELSLEDRQLLWKRLVRAAKLSLSGLPVGVTLEPDDLAGPVSAPVREGQLQVTLVGPVGELTLLCLGRRQAARVEVRGSRAAQLAFAATDISSAE